MVPGSRHGLHSGGSISLNFLFMSLIAIALISQHCAKAIDTCPTQSLVSYKRTPDSYENGTAKIHIFSKELSAKPLVLVVCLIKATALCFPKSTELTDFLSHLRKEIFPDSRSSGGSEDEEDLFYDEPDENERERAEDLELQRRLIESSDALRSALCVTRNCDSNTHTCSENIKREAIWDYFDFNRIRSDIKARRKSGQDSRNIKRSKESGVQRAQLSIAVTLISAVLTSVASLWF